MPSGSVKQVWTEKSAFILQKDDHPQSHGRARAWKAEGSQGVGDREDLASPNNNTSPLQWLPSWLSTPAPWEWGWGQEESI